MTATAQASPRGRAYTAGRTYFTRRDAATAWRRDNARNPLRDVLWRSYRTGALWTVRGPKQVEHRRAGTDALAAAERAVPFGP
jgi:hypothetical protein